MIIVLFYLFYFFTVTVIYLEMGREKKVITEKGRFSFA